jgi:hypothetical protein
MKARQERSGSATLLHGGFARRVLTSRRLRSCYSSEYRPHWFNKPEIPTPLLGTSTSWRLTSRQPALQPSQKTLDLSREASARRYVELHDQPTALVFSVDGVVRYVQRHPDFPSVLYQPGQRLSELPSPVGESRLSAHEEADPRDWLVRPGSDALIIQTLSQSRGHATTLLALDLAGSEDDDI